MRLKTIFWTILTLLVAYGGYWYYMAYHAEDFVEERLGEMHTLGFEVNYDGLDISGFPYRLIVTLKNADMRFQKNGNAIRVTAPDFHIAVQPWNFKHIIVNTYDMALTISAATVGDVMTIQPAHARMSVNSTDGRPFRLSLEMKDVALPGTNNRAERIGLHVLEGQHQDNGSEGALLEPALATIMLSIDGLSSAGTMMMSKGQVTLTPRGSQVPKLTQMGLGMWRDEGGTLDVTSLTLHGVNEGEKLEAEGSLALDEAFRPMGALTVTSHGNGPVADMLAGTGARSDSLILMDGVVLLGTEQVGITHPVLPQ